MLKTFSAKKEEVKRKWYVIDAEDQVVGRLATKAATILRGKHKPIFTPHVDTGDHIVIINCEKVRLTGRKWSQKAYHHHTTYPGGLKTIIADKLRDEHPDRIIKSAIWGMIPHNRLGRQIMSKLRIYAGSDHPHSAQKPEALEIKA